MLRLNGKAMPLGSLLIGLERELLLPHERQFLLHPMVAGVILFSRNYESPAQLAALTREIHDLRHPKLLIAVDHEGGRVQRFREGFTRLPAMGKLGEYYSAYPENALKLAQQTGYVMASELLACGVDFSFAPVLDLDWGVSEVIGDRSFAKDPYVVARLANALLRGMREAGMAGVAKHFPGHGFVAPDTHKAIAIDSRSWDEIQSHDLQPFLSLIAQNIEAIMPAHVRYSEVDAWPVGFSQAWLQRILRGNAHFGGVIVSDDLGMQAAAIYGSLSERVELALNAGCDLVLLCNELDQIQEVLTKVYHRGCPLSHARLIRMHGRGHFADLSKLHHDPLWQAAVRRVSEFTLSRAEAEFPF
jgi:beta-N-acetylhexosaminidase